MSSAMRYARMPIEIESPEELGYGNIRFNLSESSIADQTPGDFDTFFRLGYAWPTMAELEGGLAGISAALRG